MSRIDERLAALGLTRNQLAARMADDEGWNVSSASESLGMLVSCLSATEPQPYLTFQLRELTAACKALRCSSDWLLGLTDDDTRISKNTHDRNIAAAFGQGLAAEKTEHDKRWVLARDRADRAESELSNFLGDIEALIPIDCCNTRPDRLASVRAAVGMMAQKAEKAQADCMQQKQWAADAIARASKTEADARMWNERFLAEQKLAMELASQLRQDPPLASNRLVLSTAKPGTGAWAWEQMQRGPDVWVRCRGWTDGVSAVHIRSGLVHGCEDSIVGPGAGVTTLDEFERLYAYATDWELCAAPGSKEPAPAPSAKDGPTEEQCQKWLDQSCGYTFHAMSDAMVRAFHLCWQAAREGMVPKSELTAEKAERDAWQQRAEKMRTRLADEQGSHKYTKSLLARAEMERDNWLNIADELDVRTCRAEDDAPRVQEDIIAEVRQVLEAAKEDFDRTANERDQLRAELERVKAERNGWDTEAKRLEDKLVEYRVWAGDHCGTTNPEEYSDEQLRAGVDKLLAPASDELTEEEAMGWRKSASAKASENHRALRPEWLTAYANELIRLARRNHGAQPSSNPLQLPLSDEQREKLAKEAHREITLHSERPDIAAYRIIDAIAPRIAMVGLRSLTSDEIDALGREHLAPKLRALKLTEQENGELGTDCEIFVEGHEDFARAILAAAQGGQTKPVTVIIDPHCQPRHEYLIHDPEGLVKPPRGRKLTDGERKELQRYISEYDQAPFGSQAEAAAMRCYTFVESLLAPQDEVRVALGNHALEYGRWVNSSFGTKLFDAATDRSVTQALSASPGDKWSFAVVARKVE